MKLEDYRKYYIQGSDHYLIPKDEFEELLDEMDNLKEIGKDVDMWMTKYNEEFDKNRMLKKQQEKFINYLNKTIEELECNDVDDEEMKDYLIQRICTFKEILEKYKEIIDKN